MSDEVPVLLDDDQRRVAEAAARERLYVVAGPGSGKTEVVSSRLTHLAAEEELAGDSLMVISFSRAAVEAVQRRQRKNAPHTAAWVTTLDSLASRILTDAGGDVTGLGFDDRIRALLKALPEDPDVASQLTSIEHLIVDEIQDIVGLRAELLVALLRTLPSSTGFTLLGDPLQGIYDFQLTPGTLTAEDVRAQAVELGADIVHLHGQYRAQTLDASNAMAIRGDGRLAPWIHALEDHVTAMVRLRPDEISEWITATNGTLAVLTQTNAQALTVARDLHALGIDAELLGPAQDRPVDPWIARDLGSAPAQLDFDSFSSRMSEDDAVTRERWLRLRSLTRPSGRSVDVARIASRLAAGIIPVGLRSERRRVTISTIHRAKGLEFDRVLLLEPSAWYRSEGDQEAYGRALYVAITRPRNRLFTFALSKGNAWWRQDQRKQRATLTPPRKRGLIGFEVRGSDWRTSSPPDALGEPEGAQEILAGLTTDASPRPIEVRFNPYESTSLRPSYDAYLEGRRIGTLGTSFQEDFFACTGRTERWPDIDGLHLAGVETVAGPKQSGRVGQNGLWLSPLIMGPASLKWRR